MGKRKRENDYTKDEFESELQNEGKGEMPEKRGTWKRASAEVMKTRKIYKVKRRNKPKGPGLAGQNFKPISFNLGGKPKEEVKKVEESKKVEQPKLEDWECQSCFLLNDPYQAECQSCDEPNPNPVAKKQVAAVKETTQQTKKNEGDLFAKFRLQKDEWECSQCMVKNKNTVEICPSCDQPKDGSTAKASMFVGGANKGKSNGGKNMFETNMFDTTSKPTKSLFGDSTKEDKPTKSLFGGEEAKPTKSLFGGEENKPSTSLFGDATKSLFNGSSLFGNNDKKEENGDKDKKKDGDVFSLFGASGENFANFTNTSGFVHDFSEAEEKKPFDDKFKKQDKVVTGTEDETQELLQGGVTLYKMVKDEDESERFADVGKGEFKVTSFKKNGKQGYRALMYREATKKLILNEIIFYGQPIEAKGKKSVLMVLQTLKPIVLKTQSAEIGSNLLKKLKEFSSKSSDGRD